MNPNELKAQRVRLGLTQKDLAAKLGIQASSYNKKENGINPFSSIELQKLKILLSLEDDKFIKIFFDNDVILNHIDI